MATKYHISESGKPVVCPAQIKCRIGGEHFSTIQGAKEYIEKQAAAEHSTLTSVSGKAAPSVNSANNYSLQQRESRPTDIEISGKYDSQRSGGLPLQHPLMKKALDMYKGMVLSAKKSGMTPENLKNLHLSIGAAYNLHAGQTRKAQDTPYIEHPLGNASKIQELYGVNDSEILQAAVLHDVVEDCGDQYNKLSGETGKGRENAQSFINRKFGSRVGEIVAAVSNEEHKDKSWNTAQKNAAYIKHASEQIHAHPGAFAVKWSDYLDNAGTLKGAEFSDPERKKKLAAKYLPLAEEFRNAYTFHNATDSIPFSSQGKKRFNEDLIKIHQELKEILAD